MYIEADHIDGTDRPIFNQRTFTRNLTNVLKIVETIFKYLLETQPLQCI